MLIRNKFIAERSNGTEEELILDKLYEFIIDNNEPQVGKIIKMDNEKITFDCSTNNNAHVVSYKLYRISSIYKVGGCKNGNKNTL